MKNLLLARVSTFNLGLLMLILSGLSPQALAYSNYLTDFNTNYNTPGTRIDNCGLCHFNFNGGGLRTPYGEDFRNNSFSIPSVGPLDSDGDGTTNDQEAASLTNPGLSCSNLVSAQNAPADVADFVDPNNPGCIATGSPPIVNINGDYFGATGIPISFSSAGSFDPDGTIVSYLWTFGGFGTSTLANPDFTFTLSSALRILITLTITDNEGNTISDTAFVTVLQTLNSPPTADAGPPVTGVVNSSVQFDGSASSDPEIAGAYLDYRWNFADGSLGLGIRPTHTYTRCGVYNVSLEVTDNAYLTNTAITTATIASSGVDSPVAHAGGGDFRLYDGGVGTNVQFDASGSSDSDCNIVSYSWDFDDGTVGTGMSPLHSYTTAGVYVVTLTVTDNDGLQATDFATVSVIDTGPLDGAALYQTNCAGCHGADANSTKIGATVTRINDGIVNVPSMNGLSTMTATEIQAISDYLASLTPLPSPTDGPTLYANNCAGCHGPGDSSTKIGATVTRINDGIVNVPSMNGLSTMTATEIQAISDYLVSLTPLPSPTDGPTLYANNCAGCHGLGDSSAKSGATVTRIINGIANVPSMNGLSALSTADIDAIAAFLATAPAPTTPEGLYAANCASCHGADGSGGTSEHDVRGDSARKISEAIQGESEMLSLSFLSTNEIQLISDFLNGITSPPPGGGTGEEMYAASCASCHGAGATSAKAGATVARINNGIAAVSSMNGLSSLPAADIQTISDYLVSLAPTPPPPGTTDGELLYVINCSGCHGAGDASAKAGATASRISSGIATVSSMGGLAWLTTADIDAIAAFLATAPAPTTPEGLYAASCASCHGADGSGGTSEHDVRGDSARKISEAIQGESEMRSLSFLSTNEIQLISDFLNGITSPPPGGGTGEEMYAASCASCHGAGATSAKAGATVARINNGIAAVSSMNGLSSLPAADIQTISDYLVSLAPTPPPPGTTDGELLYVINCSGCHGAGDASAKAGATASRISSGIATVSSMGGLAWLTTADIDAIAAFLATAPAPTTPEGLYAASCASCHGADGSGGTSEHDVRGDSARKISEAIQGESEMRSLSFLSTNEIQLISDFLNGNTSGDSWSRYDSWSWRGD